jgi:Protein of unknown function (DUF3467)
VNEQQRLVPYLPIRRPPQTINGLTVFVSVRLLRLDRLPLSGGSFLASKSFTLSAMSNPTQPNVKLMNGPDYRENYANSVQMRVNIWDFFLVFGTLQQQTETHVEIKNFEGIYLSPQQAKALLGLLQQNVAGYESAFGEIKLDPRMGPQGPVH